MSEVHASSSNVEMGDWVEVSLRNLLVGGDPITVDGYVLNVHEDKLNVNVVLKGKGTDIEAISHQKASFRYRDIFLANKTINYFDLPQLIDIALQTRDEEWFKELTELMQGWLAVETLNEGG